MPPSILHELAAVYRVSRKRKDINRFTRWVARPPATVIVYALRDSRVTPNQLTLASLAVCAGSAAMFALLPGYWGLVAAAAVFELSFVLDCADGQLARLRGSHSTLGHLLDFLTDELKALLVLAGVSIRLWRDTEQDLYLVVGMGALVALASGTSFTAFMRRPEYGAPEPTRDGQPAMIPRRRGALGYAVTLAEHLARTIVHYPSYIWITALLGRMDLYLWPYSTVSALYLGRCLLIVTGKLGRFLPDKGSQDAD